MNGKTARQLRKLAYELRTTDRAFYVNVNGAREWNKGSYKWTYNQLKKSYYQGQRKGARRGLVSCGVTI